jgi:hypothetical protein
MVGGSLRVLRLLPPQKLGRHEIAEILLKVALNTKNQIKSNQIITMSGVNSIQYNVIKLVSDLW